MSYEDKLVSVSAKISPLFHAGKQAEAWDYIASVVRDGPLEDDDQELYFLCRVTQLHSIFADARSAREWIDRHELRRAALGPISDRVHELYKVVRLSLDLAVKDYSSLPEAKSSIDWEKVRPWPWALNVRIKVSVLQNCMQEVLALLRRPTAATPSPAIAISALDQTARLADLAEIFYLQGYGEKARGLLRAALRRSSQVSGIFQHVLQLGIKGRWGAIAFAEGRLEEAEAYLTMAAEGVRSLKLEISHLQFQHQIAMVLAERGNSVSAETGLLGVAKAARALWRSSGSPAPLYLEARSLTSAAVIAAEAGRLRQAGACLGRARRLLTLLSSGKYVGLYHLVKGYLQSRGKSKSKRQQALLEFEKAERCFLAHGDGARSELLRLKVYRAAAYLRLGRPQEALQEAREGALLAQRDSSFTQQERCFQVISQIIAAKDCPDAESVYDELIRSLTSIRNPIRLFKVLSNLYLYTWDQSEWIDRTDYCLKQLNRMAQVLDRKTFCELYAKHVTGRVARRALVVTFGLKDVPEGEELDL